MAIRLINPEATEKVAFGSTVFDVKRVSHSLGHEIRRRVTKAGKTDEDAFRRAVWGTVLVGWTGLIGEGDVEIPYTKPAAWDASQDEWVYHVAQMLPDFVADRIWGVAYKDSVDVSGALGN